MSLKSDLSIKKRLEMARPISTSAITDEEVFHLKQNGQNNGEVRATYQTKQDRLIKLGKPALSSTLLTLQWTQP